MDKIEGKINDNRLTSDLRRSRSGRVQEFAQQGKRSFDPDFVIEPPRKELYAKLIEGSWYWANGCSECNGQSRSWKTYIECEAHDVCRICGLPRVGAKQAYGNINGWSCEDCHNAERYNEAVAALHSAEPYDEYDYIHEQDMKCPHCGTTSNDCGYKDDRITCDLCGGVFDVEVETQTLYTTSIVGERLTKPAKDMLQ